LDQLGRSRSPVYDLVTTTAYLPADTMALTLNGSTRWPDAATLRTFGETREIGSPAFIRAILDRVAEAVFETRTELLANARGRPAFAEVAVRMEAAWGRAWPPWGAADDLRSAFGSALRQPEVRPHWRFSAWIQDRARVMAVAIQGARPSVCLW